MTEGPEGHPLRKAARQKARMRWKKLGDVIRGAAFFKVFIYADSNAVDIYECITHTIHDILLCILLTSSILTVSCQQISTSNTCTGRDQC